MVPKSLIFFSIVLLITFLETLIAFCLNTWVHGGLWAGKGDTVYDVKAGLWQVCRSTGAGHKYFSACNWIYGSEGADGVGPPPDFWVICQILFVVGFTSVLVATAMLPCYIYTIKAAKRTAFRCIGVNMALLLIITAVVLGAGLLYFGIKYADYEYYDDPREYYQLRVGSMVWHGFMQRLGWGFFVMIMGWCQSVFTAAFFITVHIHLKHFYI